MIVGRLSIFQPFYWHGQSALESRPCFRIRCLIIDDLVLRLSRERCASEDLCADRFRLLTPDPAPFRHNASSLNALALRLRP